MGRFPRPYPHSSGLPRDSPTWGPNMIDLVWANSALFSLGISSEIATDLPPLADHEPILTIIKWGLSDLPWYLPPFSGPPLMKGSFKQHFKKRNTMWLKRSLPSHHLLPSLNWTGLQPASSRQSPLLWRLLPNRHSPDQVVIDGGTKIVPTLSRCSAGSHRISAPARKTYKKPDKPSSGLYGLANTTSGKPK